MDSFHQTYVWAGNLDPLIFFIGMVIVFIINFIPSIIAYSRRHANRLAILILNIIFGWTGIVWIVLLIWALSGEKSSAIRL